MQDRPADAGVSFQVSAHRALDVRLERIAQQHGTAIDPGLERLRRVAARAGLTRLSVPLATVAGTNGKGSTVAMLAAVWQAAGHRVGAATSPHLVHFNERIRIDGHALDPARIQTALDQLEPHIAPDTLTYFEIAMLASVACFEQAECDVVVLEVGLGGRLDAANLWDADVAILTSVALDHADWLGTDLDVIATEKAAIGRRGRPLILGESDPPASLAPFAAQAGIELVLPDAARVPDTLSLAGAHQRRNAACAIAAIDRLQHHLPVAPDALATGLSTVQVDARLQRYRHDGVPVCLDVAHNPHAAQALAATLAAAPAAGVPAGDGHWHLVFAALADKDIEGIVQALAPVIASIACVPLSGARALAVADLAARVRATGGAEGIRIDAHASMLAGARSALQRASADGGGVLVCGSFQTVGDWLGAFDRMAR